MASSGDAKFESFNDYPWLDYNRYQDKWLPVVGAGSNAKERYCILTSVGEKTCKAIVTKDIYDTIMGHGGRPLEVKYTFDADKELYIEMREIARSG